MKKLTILGLLLVFVLLLSSCIGGADNKNQTNVPPTSPPVSSQVPTASNATQGIQVGTPAPDFQLSDLSGKRVSLSEYRGKVVYLNFWATW